MGKKSHDELNKIFSDKVVAHGHGVNKAVSNLRNYVREHHMRKYTLWIYFRRAYDAEG